MAPKTEQFFTRSIGCEADVQDGKNCSTELSALKGKLADA
jgi:hypothetical protein